MIGKNAPLLAGLIAGITYGMCTGQVLMSFVVSIVTIIIVALLVFGYKKVAKKLLTNNLEVTRSKESPKYDNEGNGYYLVELGIKQRNWLYNLFFRGARLEMFAKARFQGERGDLSCCPTDEISLGLDRPERRFVVAYDKTAKLNIVKSKDFVFYSLKETDFCGRELEGNYSLTILVYINKKEIKLPCPLCIKEGKISGL